MIIYNAEGEEMKMRKNECRTGRPYQRHIRENNMLPQIGIVSTCIRYILACVSLILICHLSNASDMPQYTRTDYALTERAKFILTGAVNRDNYPDVIVVGWQGAIHVFPGKPGGVLGAPVVTNSDIKSPNLAIADDFNNDGLTDICVNDTLFVSNGEGGFAPPKLLGIERLQTLASTDMNGDGKKDLIAIVIINTTPNMRAAELRTYFGDGAGTFGEPKKTRIVFTSGEVNWQPESGEIIDDRGSYEILYVGNLTNDGVPDLIVRHYYSPASNPATLYYNRTYTGSYGGTFVQNPLYSGANTQIVGVHDFNGDGAVDIMESFTYMAQLYYGNNTGQFDSVRQIRMDSSEIGLDNNSRTFSTDDINSDGILDIVIIRQIQDSSGARYCKLVAIPWNKNEELAKKHEFSVYLPDNFLGYGDWRNPGAGGIMSCILNEDAYTDFITTDDYTNALLSVILSTHSTVRVDSGEEIPMAFLGQNSPNPFNSSTVILYSIKNPGIYELAVHDVLGRKIIIVSSGYQTRGEYRTVWNGKTDHGAYAASGFYFYVLTRGKEAISSKRLLIIR